MVTIHVWPGSGVIGSGGNVGHCAMTCGSTYISWWPASGGVSIGGAITQRLAGVTVPGAPETYSTDVASEGGAPQSFAFDGVFNELMIIAGWRVWQSVGTYNIGTRSCCACVLHLLVAGGLRTVYPNYHTYSAGGRPSPNDMLGLGRALRTSVRPERAPSMR